MADIKSGRKAADVKLFVAIPAMDHKNFCALTGALLEFQAALIMAGLTQTPMFEFAMQESNLPFGRNRILAQFMASECTDLICIDADNSSDCASLMRLVCHPVDFVGAMYLKKVQNPATGALMEKWAGEFLDSPDDGRLQGYNADLGLLEVKRLPAGFMRITRKAVQRMINECGVVEYDHDLPDGRVLHIHRLFENFWDGKQDVGEDFTFCDRWRSIGGQVWCDPELKVDHHGPAVWKGRLGDYLRGLMVRDAEQEAA